MQEKLFFKNSKGSRLCGLLSHLSSSKKDPIIILCHGFSTTKNSNTFIALERILHEKNISTFRFDFFGHGESEGKFEDVTISEAVDDVLSAIAFLKEKGFSRIGLVGSSFGGMAALLAASKSPDIYVLALKSPVSDYLGKLIAQKSNEEIESWKEKGFIHYPKTNGEMLKLNYSFFEDTEKVSGFEAAKKIKVPTLIVHGDRDVSVPVEQSKKTAKMIENCRLEVIRGADHPYSNSEHFQRVLNLIADFIVENS